MPLNMYLPQIGFISGFDMKSMNHSYIILLEALSCAYSMINTRKSGMRSEYIGSISNSFVLPSGCTDVFVYKPIVESYQDIITKAQINLISVEYRASETKITGQEAKFAGLTSTIEASNAWTRYEILYTKNTCNTDRDFHFYIITYLYKDQRKVGVFTFYELEKLGSGEIDESVMISIEPYIRHLSSGNITMNSVFITYKSNQDGSELIPDKEIKMIDTSLKSIETIFNFTEIDEIILPTYYEKTFTIGGENHIEAIRYSGKHNRLRWMPIQIHRKFGEIHRFGKDTEEL